MHLKRFLAALAAMCVLAAPAALAATATPTASQPTTTPSPQARAAAAHQRAHHQAYKRHMKLARKAAWLSGRRLRQGYYRKAKVARLAWLNHRNAQLRREIRKLRRVDRQYRAALRGVSYGTLHAIASCESHDNPRAIGGGGSYRGMFQMTFHIWGAVGGHGDPAAATVKEQYLRAALVYRRYGSGQWPVCGR
jgi:Ni/Co efflux regulator RcnB